MNDFLTFFRFILPGIVFLLVLIISCYFIELDIVQKPQSLNNGSITLLGLLLTSGTGYIFSILYRFFSPVHGFDQVKVVNELMENNLIFVNDFQNKKISPIEDNKGGKEKSYEIINVIWHLNHEHFDTDKTKFQASILNSLGATFTAVLVSIVLFILLCAFTPPASFSLFKFAVILIILIAFLVLLFFQLRHSQKMYQRWVDSTFVSVLNFLKGNKVAEKTIIISKECKDAPKPFINSITYVE